MSFIGKFFIALFSFLGVIMLTFMLFRLSNNHNAYIGVSDVYYYFKTTPFDTYDAFTKMSNHFSNVITEFENAFTDFSGIKNPLMDGFDWYDIFTILYESLKYVVYILFNGIRVLLFPIVGIFYLLEFIFGIIAYIINC